MTDYVELTLPARPDSLVLARMTVGAVAARADMPVDEIEDLRLAIDELCLSSVGDARGGRLELRYEWDDSAMVVSCTFRPSDLDTSTGTEKTDGATRDAMGTLPSDLSERILDALVDEHGREKVGDGERAWFKKRHVRARS